MTARIGLIAASAALLLVAVAAILAFTRTDGASGDNTAASEADVPFLYLDGSEGNLADFAGTPVLVNFWASWCPPCVAEMPDLERVHQLLGDEVVFIGLNLQETNPAGAEALIEQTGVTYLLGEDPDGAIFARFGGIGMPTTVLMDDQGQVVTTHTGVIFADDLEALIRSELLES